MITLSRNASLRPFLVVTVLAPTAFSSQGKLSYGGLLNPEYLKVSFLCSCTALLLAPAFRRIEDSYDRICECWF